MLSPDYLDGRFFRVTLLTDDRLAAVARLAGLSEADLAESRAYLTPLPDGAVLLDQPALHEPPAVRWLARTATWGGLALEAIVAALFLWRRPGEPLPQTAEHVSNAQGLASQVVCLARLRRADVLTDQNVTHLRRFKAVKTSGRIVAWCGHAAIVVFCVATYALAPVAGFGWLLLAMGLATCGSHERGWRHTYVAAFCLVTLYAEIPWAALLADAVR